VNQVFRKKQGPNEILNAVEHLYYRKKYKDALELCNTWLQLNSQHSKPFKNCEIVEIAIRCCIKLGMMKDALEFAMELKVCWVQLLFSEGGFNRL
jgi:hypothetical protein